MSSNAEALAERFYRDFRPGLIAYFVRVGRGEIMGKGILLWLLGVPLPIILLLLLFWH